MLKNIARDGKTKCYKNNKRGFRKSHMLNNYRRTVLVFIASILILMVELLSPAIVEARPMLGANKFDLILQYTGRASGLRGSDSDRVITIPMARRAIDDAVKIGLRFFRVSAAGYAPSGVSSGQQNDLTLWMSQPLLYWQEVDQMFDDLDRADLKIVPSFLWNIAQFPAITGEDEGVFVRDRNSKSRKLFIKYVTEFIVRYKSRKTILFYEFSNELNLVADLDLDTRCKKQYGPGAEKCMLIRNISTDDVINLSKEFITVIRKVDPDHKISSGFSMPTLHAEHLRLQPEFSSIGADWTRDSERDLSTNLSNTQSLFDIITVHLYKTSTDALGGPDNTIRLLKTLADSLGKALFIGEFGSDEDNQFVGEVSSAIEKFDVQFSAIWVWEFYQKDLETPAPFNVDPDKTPDRIADLKNLLEKNNELP